jgi:hypothetical protein
MGMWKKKLIWFNSYVNLQNPSMNDTEPPGKSHERLDMMKLNNEIRR